MPHQGPQPKHLRMVKRAARKHGIPAKWLYGLWGAEHGLRTHGFARSRAGAQGPFQFMPATARSYGINPYKFGQAADAAAKYLATYKGRGLEGMYRAYNAGPAGGPNPESADHYQAALRFMKQWPGNVDLHPGSGSNGRGRSPQVSPARSAGKPPEGLTQALTAPQGVSAPLSGIADPAVSARRFLRLPEEGHDAPSSGAPPAPNATLTERLRSTAVPMSPAPVAPVQSPLQSRLGLAPQQRLGPGGLVKGSDYVRDGVLYRWDPRAKKYVRPGSRKTIRQVEAPRRQSGGGRPIHGGGGYGGTANLRKPAMEIAQRMGVPVSSLKRSYDTVEGPGVSDHYTGATRSYAVDFDTPGTNKFAAGNATGHRLARRLARRFGVRYIPNSYESGGIFRAAGGRRYKVQLLYGGGVRHGDHVHIGFKAL